LLLTHFVPNKTGQAACLVNGFLSPLGNKLYQKAAARRIGFTLAPTSVKTVPPPFTGASSYFKMFYNDLLRY
jgi:hypothetical protein